MGGRFRTSSSSYLRAASAILFALAGTFFMFAQPGIVGALVDEMGFSLEETASIVSSQAAGQLTAIFATSLLLRYLNIRRAAVWGGLSLITLETVCTQLDSTVLFIPARFIAGLCAGACLALATAVISGMRGQERLFATSALAQAVTGMIFMFSLPHLLPKLGMPLIHMSIAGIVLAALALGRHLPSQTSDSLRTESSTAQVAPINLRLPIVVLVSLAFFYLAVSATWPYAERIGRAGELSAQAVGEAFGIMGLVGIGLSVYIVYLGPRAGNFVPIVGGLVCMFGACACFLLEMQFTTYLAGIGLLGASVIFASPYYLSLLAVMDRSGRFGVLGMGSIYASQVFAPLIGPVVVEADNYAPLLKITAAACAASTLALLYVFLASSRRAARDRIR